MCMTGERHPPAAAAACWAAANCDGNEVGSLRSWSKTRCERFLYGLGEYPELRLHGELGVLDDEVPTDDRER